MLTHLMARHLAESGADLNCDLDCALALHRAMQGSWRQFASNDIAERLSAAMAQAAEIRTDPDKQSRPVVSYRGQGGRFTRRAA